MKQVNGTRGRRFVSVASLGDHPRDAVVVAVVLFAAVFVLRSMTTAAADVVTFLYVIPVVIVAIALGERGGLGAGIVAFALSILWTTIENVALGPLGYLGRAVIFLLIGGLVGRFANGLRSLEAESVRHFDLSGDLTCIAGVDGYFKRVNPAFERILGYSREELLARPYAAFVHPEDLQRTAEEAAAILDGRGTVQFQNRYLAKNGAVHWLEWTTTPLRDEGLIYAVARDITDRKVLEQELERLSQHDSLTGLCNRRRFDQVLEEKLDYTRRYGNGGALLLLDLDRFKQINDELGHAAGDKALCAVADVLQRNLRQSDMVARASTGVVARLGGDEFAVLLPEADQDAAKTVAARLVDALGDVRLTVDGLPIRLAVSIGIALFDGHNVPPAEDLLAEADRAMYEAKAAGGAAMSIAVSRA